MGENLFGKAVIYTDVSGEEWPGTICGPLECEESKIPGAPKRVKGRKNVGGVVTPGKPIVSAEEEREVATGNESQPVKKIRTLDIAVNWGHQTTTVTGVRQASSLDGSRKAWRLAPEQKKPAPEQKKDESKKEGGDK